MVKRSEKLETMIHYLLLAVLALLFLLPLLWMLIASIDPGAIQTLKLPEAVSFENFASILSDQTIIRSFGIGFLLSIDFSCCLMCFGSISLVEVSAKI